MFRSKENIALIIKLAALDAVSINLMITDKNLNIIYMNLSMVALLTEAEADIKADLPTFNAAALIGKGIDAFHKNPNYQCRLLKRLQGTHRATIRVSNRIFDLVVTPIFDGRGKPIGMVVEWSDSTQRLMNLDYSAQLAAVGKSQAIIEFEMDGTVIAANDRFLDALGYSRTEIQGKNHSMFVEPNYSASVEYEAFWAALNRGEYQAAEYKRIGKGGREVWIQASYNPVMDADGKPFKVVKFATDVSEIKLRNADYAGQISAIEKSQAVIAFNLDGTIISANANFLAAMGYTLAEVRGKHHSMFVEASYRSSADYRDFWNRLARGDYQAAEYKRIGKGGKEVWIQGSYNPILDLNGKPFKVVKFATDITTQVTRRMRSEHVSATMENVAAGAEELNASVREIAQSMVLSREAADDAHARAVATNGSTERLADAAQSMNNILAMINDITSQINLLALNATIEAARAGDADKGFAVVANEVRNLAAGAKLATDEIAREVTGMKDISREVVNGLQSIKTSIDRVREYVTSTASAVEEQSVVTNEISASIQQAAIEAQTIG